MLGGITSLEDEQGGLWTEVSVLLSGEAIVAPITTVRETILHRQDATLEFMLWCRHLVRVVLQHVVCSRFHSVTERAACWLLLLQDRLDGVTNIPITHDQLSQTLGVHRSSVTLGLKELAANGSIAPGGRGLVAIQDRAGLQALSCECHPIISTRRPFPAWVHEAQTKS